jgi:hypothetical protein
MVVEVSRAELWSASVVLVFGGSSAQLARPADDYRARAQNKPVCESSHLNEILMIEK